MKPGRGAVSVVSLLVLFFITGLVSAQTRTVAESQLSLGRGEVRCTAERYGRNGDLIAATAFTNPVNGTARFSSNGSFTYKPNPGFQGADTFTYRVSDGLISSNTATVTITVQ